VIDHDRPQDPRLRLSRRGFLKASGAGAVAATGALGAIPFRQSAAFAQNGWDEEHDVVVVGSGGAGFAAAVTAKSLGSDVVILEKGTYAGGTTLVSGGTLWIPNNKQMADAGIEDPREDCLKYMARYSFPAAFDADAEQYGLGDHDWEMLTAFYDKAAEATAAIEDAGAVRWSLGYISGRPDQLNVDYQAQFDEDVTKEGRGLVPLDENDERGGGGVLIASYQAWAEANGLPVLLQHRAERLLLNDAGEVIGVEVSVSESSATPEATPAPSVVKTFRARKGVIFGSGGYSKSAELMRHLVVNPYYGGCGAATNEGDFLKMSSSVNAMLGNLHSTWRNEGIYELALASPAAYNCIWYYNGDAFLQVNRHGYRYTNEHANYQDRNQTHYDWQATGATWDNLITVLIYDQRIQDNWAFGYPFPTDPSTTPYVLIADTLDELADKVLERFASLDTITPGMAPSENFKSNMLASVATFNEYAAAGVDPDFQRGVSEYDTAWNALPANLDPWPSADQPNESMYPISDTSPYYAMLTAPSIVDTKGGPVINSDAQVLTWDGTPVVGLYGAGNAVACPGVDAYWGAGATLGHATCWGYAAGKHAHESAGTSE
jgi:3-oxosteroid 1-dehydrogenase